MIRSSGMRGIPLIVMLMAGCLAAPSPRDDGDDDSDNDSTDLDDDGSASVSGEATDSGLTLQADDGRFRMEFEGFGMPTQMSIDNTAMLTEVPHACPREQGTGLALFPWNAVDSVQRALNTSSLTFRGPVVAGVAYDWQQPINCGGQPQSFHGTTRFTIFPDGRIHRFDEANIGQPDGTAESMMGVCEQCGDGQATGDGDPMNTFLTSFATVRADEGLVPGLVPVGDTAVTNDPVCVRHGGQALAFSWASENGLDYTSVGQRRVIRSGLDAILVHDWVRGEDLVEKQMPEGYQVHTTWLPGAAAECDALLERAGRSGPHNADLSVEQPGDPEVRHPLIGRDGMFQNRTGGPLAIPIGDIHLSTTNRIPPGWAFYFELGPQQGRLDVSIEPADVQGTWFREQRIIVDSTHHDVILWFRDGLEPGEVISLHPSM